MIWALMINWIELIVLMVSSTSLFSIFRTVLFVTHCKHKVNLLLRLPMLSAAKSELSDHLYLECTF